MKKSSNPYLKHLFVCTKEREQGEAACGKAGEALCEFLKSYVELHGLRGKVRVTRSGCFDLCAQGPNVMVTPRHVWYSKVEKDEAEKILKEILS
ncbi:MAG: (2Fe-2S) ferredoxin domain-containing protein [Chlamydiae bacterium]|nr:(2Fe-2S) ferredoxin domain-containing protein [Chlamydiota bacterium]MBI3265854.1 (2Fe-2S) ferredoxin domain-containing protein [Chlamydiota bacterium]